MRGALVLVLSILIASCSYGAGGTYVNRMKFQAHDHPDTRADIQRVFDAPNSDATRAVALCVWSTIEAIDHRHEEPSRFDLALGACRRTCPTAASTEGPLREIAARYARQCESNSGDAAALIPIEAQLAKADRAAMASIIAGRDLLAGAEQALAVVVHQFGDTPNVMHVREAIVHVRAAHAADFARLAAFEADPEVQAMTAALATVEAEYAAVNDTYKRLQHQACVASPATMCDAETVGLELERIHAKRTELRRKFAERKAAADLR